MTIRVRQTVSMDSGDVNEVEKSSHEPRRTGSGSTLDQYMPVLLFFGLYNLVNIKAAVIASTMWSIKATVSRRRAGLDIGWWLPSVTAYLILRSGVTILVDEEIIDFGISSEAVYFGIGFVTKFLVGLCFAVTIIIGKPFVAWAIPKVVELAPSVIESRTYVRVMANVTWLIVAFEWVSATWDIWLFNNAGLNFFFLTRTGVNFAMSFIAITGALTYIDRKLGPLDEYPGLIHILESSGRTSQ
jgi:hypothetical protein